MLLSREEKVLLDFFQKIAGFLKGQSPLSGMFKGNALEQ